MAIVSDLTVDIIINSIKVDEYELSDTLDNYTIDDIHESAYCGMYNPARRNNFKRTADYGWNVGFDVDNGTFRYPFTTKAAGSTYDWMSGDTGYNSPDGLYSCIVWLKKESVGSPAYVINTDNINDYRLVTKWNVNKFVYELPALDTTFAQVASNTWAEQKVYPTAYYAPGKGIMRYHTNIGESDDETTSIDIYPYMLFTFDDDIYFLAVDQNWEYNMYFSTAINLGSTPAEFAGSNATSFDKTAAIGTSYNTDYQTPAPNSSGYNNNFQLSGYPGNNRGTFQWQGPGGYTKWYQVSCEDEQNYICGWDHSGYQYQGGYIRIHWLFSKLHDSLLYFANSGVYFLADKLYKPIIEDTIVTGYTDDLTTASDIDDWDGSSIHDVPITPPVPPTDPDEDNDDPVSTVGAPFASGLAHYYVTTAGSSALSQISEAMSTWDIDATKKDLYKNLISCKLIKPPAGIPSTPSVFEIYGVKPQYQGADITIPAVDGNPDITFGPYNIDRKFNDFRDFAPYTKVEIHLPYCGWCALPSHVVGRSVSVHYYTDVIAATCKAVVFCGNNIVAEAAGVIGLDIPFASENVGAKIAAATSGLLSYGQGALQASAGIGQMAATRSSQGLKNAAGGLSQVISGYTQMAMAANENWTEICGKNGDGCCLSGATDIIIKITRPKKGAYTDAPYVPPGFAHAVGFVSAKQVRVSNITGLLIADNVDTSGISGATDAERAEIKRVLETGLIVNSAPPEE